MRIPISWLNEYVDVSDLSVQELSDKLTFSGVEVEGIETDGPALDDHFVVNLGDGDDAIRIIMAAKANRGKVAWAGKMQAVMLEWSE